MPPTRADAPAVLTMEDVAPIEAAAGPDLRMTLSGTTAPTSTKPLPMVAATCPVRMAGGPVAPDGALTKLELNYAMMGVSGNVVVRSHLPELKVDVPRSAVLAKAIARELPSGALDAQSLTHVEVVPDFDGIDRIASSPSGSVMRTRGANVIVDSDPSRGFRRIFVRADALRDDFNLDKSADRKPFRALEAERVDVGISTPRPFPPPLKKDASVFCGGLISISAEPPEGFFAASTAMELLEKGHAAKPAAEADAWLYRVPDSRRASYFEFNYAAPDRPADTPRDDKFKIATGVGPASDPTSAGGAEADLLWLGDEQHGALSEYLKTLAKPDLTLADLGRHQGFIHRLNDHEVLLASPDRAHAMTREGFNGLRTDPALYRRVYSEEYDQYLHGLFEHAPGEAQAKGSYLLATSRGCTQGCTLCSSGGLKAFQYFTAPRMMEELEKIAQHASLKDGELLDVYLLDSNLNNNPKRLIEFADLYEKSPLEGKFRFYCRHSTPNGFLSMTDSGDKAPNRELISAYRRLGLTQVFMGIDTYDDASTLTLKSNRNQVAKKAESMRPTYRATEIRELIRAMEAEGLTSKGFMLTNNPWVSDLDRIDGYYNVHELWLENPHFSVDSRNRDVMRLKPFEGSPIQQVADRKQLDVLEQGRFAAKGVLGEMDESMTFEQIGRPRAHGDAGAALGEFADGIGRLRRGAEAAAVSTTKEKAQQIMRKIIARDAALAPMLEREKALGTPNAARFLEEARAFAEAHADLPPLGADEQKAEFLQSAESLFDGLRQTLPIKMEKS